MSRMLIDHGTVLARLKPANILQAAEADLRLKERKRERTADAEEHYAFHRRHVQRARNAAHLIALAYFEPTVADTTTKHGTVLVYHDRALLRETLATLLVGDELDGMLRVAPEHEPPTLEVVR